MRTKFILDRRFYVYKIINNTNDKIYIGKSNTSKNRWKEHLSIAAKGGPAHQYFYLHKSINKYGKDNFEYEIIEYFDKENSAYLAEIFYIKLYKSNIPKYGMNLNSGGLGGMRQNAETKEKIRQKRLGFKFTEEVKQKMSQSHKGQRPVFANFTDDEVIQIRRMHHLMKVLKIKYAAKILATEYDVSVQSIRFVISGKNYKHVQFENLPNLSPHLAVCSKCNQINDKTEFAQSKGAKSGLQSRCRKCDKITYRSLRKR